MALTAGSVTINPDGTETKSGAAASLYDKFVARVNAKLVLAGQAPLGNNSDSVPTKNGMAEMATDIAVWMVTEITTNARAHIDPGTGGLQRTPNPNDPLTVTLPPVSDKYLFIV